MNLQHELNKEAAVEAAWKYLETDGGAIFGDLFDQGLISLDEFHDINIIMAEIVNSAAWAEYSDVKATTVMLFLAELGELE